MRTVSASLAAALCCTAAVPAHAEPDESNTHLAVLPERELAGHYFLPPLAMRMPFITTHVGSSTGVGMGDFEDIPIGGGETMDLSFFNLVQFFDLQLGLFDRVAIRGELRGDAVAPSDEETALNIALLGDWSGGAGVTVKALETERFQLSGSFDYAYAQDVTVTPGVFLADILDKAVNQGVWDPDADLLFMESKQSTYSFGAEAAFAPHELVGLLGEVAWDAETQEERNDAFLRVGAALSLNFDPVGVPVGLLGYWVERFPMDSENSTDVDRLFGAGLFYTGRHYLDVGVELQSQRFDTEDFDSSSIGAAGRIRAYF